MTDRSRERTLLNELLALMVECVRDLNQGKALPDSWRMQIETALRPLWRQGRPAELARSLRDREISDAMFKYEYDAARGLPRQRKDLFQRLLAKKHQVTAANLHAIYRRNKAAAWLRSQSKKVDQEIRDANWPTRQFLSRVTKRAAELRREGSAADDLQAFDIAFASVQKEFGTVEPPAENLGMTYESRIELIDEWVKDGMNKDLHLPPFLSRVIEARVHRPARVTKHK